MSSSFGFFGARPNTQLAVALALLIGSGLPSRSEPVGTSFSYRGSLSINGSPANATYDLKFTVFDSFANGTQVSPTITNATVVVTNGIFNVALDFGTNAFVGEKRWLEVGVRASGDPSDFDLLTPRQELAPQPYSLYASSADSANIAQALAPGALSAPFSLTNPANTFIGSFGGDGGGLTNLNTAGLASTNYVSAAVAGYVTSALTNVAFNDQNNVFQKPVAFMGEINQIYSQSMIFIRPDAVTPSWLEWWRMDDTNVNHYCALGMDFANGGGFWSFYDSALNEDVFEIGVDPPLAGRFRMGRDQLNPHVQLSIHDLDANISNSLDIYSYNNGINVNSRNPNSDMVTIQRDGMPVSHWLRWYQGNGTEDWRVGMGNNTYNLEFWSAAGASSSAAKPGTLWMSLNRNPSNSISFYVPITGDGSGLTGVNATTLGGQSAAAFWQTGGNSGTSPRNNSLGTTDNQPLDLKVNNTRAFRLEPVAAGSPNVIGGGPSNATTPGAVGATIGGGQNNVIAQSVNSTISGGFNNTSSAMYGTIPGGAQANARVFGQMAYASGQFGSAGDAQTSVYVCRGITTDATSKELFLDGSSARMLVPTNATWGFDILITGRAANGDSGVYQLRGAIKNNSGTVQLIGPANKSILGADVPSWDATVGADPVNQGLVINVTGQANTTVRWVASVRTVEVGFSAWLASE